jgi:hypothetical protein
VTPFSGSTIRWRRLDASGHETAQLVPMADGPRLSGVAELAHERGPCRLEYDIECSEGWLTRRARVSGRIGGRAVALDVARDERGAWTSAGVPLRALEGCFDVDLEFSPSTNLLPIRRLMLAVGERAAVRTAWVRFPTLALQLLEQTYTRTGAMTYRYETADGTFCRDLTVNADGFVLDYPGLWRADVVPAPRAEDAPDAHPASSDPSRRA